MKGKCFLMVFLIFACFLYCEVNLSKTDWDKDGKEEEIVLENQYWRMVFKPETGGKVIELNHKLSNRNICAKDGIFRDGIVELTFEGREIFSLDNLPYRYEIVKQAPEEGVIKVYTDLPYYFPEPEYSKVSIIKTYTMKDNSPLIEVNIAIKNNSSKKLPVSLQIRNSLTSTDISMMPDFPGVLKIRESIGRYHTGLVAEEPVRPWMGFLIRNPLSRFLIFTEWRYLDGMEISRDGQFWGYRTQTISPGAQWETNYYVYSFKGMYSIDEVSKDYAIGIMVKGKDSVEQKFIEGKITDSQIFPINVENIIPGEKIPVKIQVATCKMYEEEMELVFGTRDVSQKKIDVIGKNKIRLKSPAVSEMDFEYEAKKDGLVLLVVQLIKDGKVILEAEKPVRVGQTHQMYLMKKIEEKQIGEKNIALKSKNKGCPDFYEKIDLGFETPHTKWAKPYYKGATRVLFVSLNNNDIGHWREIYERFDIVPEVAVLVRGFSANIPYSVWSQKNLYKKLAEDNYDVIFFACVDWDKGLTEPLKNEIYSRIKNGKGAVIILPTNAPFESLEKFIKENGTSVDIKFLSTGQPFKTPGIEGYEVGKGRVALVKGSMIASYETITYILGELRPEKNKWIPGWEYAYGFFGKAIYWAGKKFEDIRIEQIACDEGKAKIIFDSSIKEKARIDLKVRDKTYEVENSIKKEIEIKEGKNEIEIPLNTKEFSNGLHIIETIVENRKGEKIVWGGYRFNQDSSPVVVDLELEKKVYREGEQIYANVNLNKKVQDTKVMNLSISVYDRWGRMVFKESKDVELKQEKEQLRLPLNFKNIDILHDVEVEIKGDGVKDKDRETIYIVQKRMPLYDDFYLGCWGNVSGSVLKLQATAKTLVEQAGIDYVYCYLGEDEVELAYRNGVLLAGPPFTFSLRELVQMDKANKDKLTFGVSLYPDQKRLDEWKTRLQKTALDYMTKAGVDYFFLDDERRIEQDYDFSEETIKGFREYLVQQYKSLEKLNSQWGTDFKTWEEVTPIRREEIKDTTNISRWLDWRRFIGWVVSEYYVNYPARVMKEVNPQAVVGMHGIYYPNQPGRNCPHDFWLMSKGMKVTAGYNDMLQEWFNSFGVISGPYSGYGMTYVTPSRRYHPWRSLFHGGHWAYYYQLWTSGTLFYSVIAPDQTAQQPYKVLANEEFKDIKSGIGKLFINSKFSHDGIALPYSQASLLASDVLGLDHRNTGIRSFKTLVQDLGYQHITLSYEQIEKGSLNNKDFRLFIGPRLVCLSDEEVKNIKEFVRNGGIVLTDFGFGSRDIHGKLINSPFDEVFGINRNKAKMNKVTEEIVFNDNAPDVLRDKGIIVDVVEEGIDVKNGKVWAKSASGRPAIIVNRYGKGYGIYLNLDLQRYILSNDARGVEGSIRTTGEEAENQREFGRTIKILFTEILKIAGIENPRIRLIDKEGKQVAGETFYYDGEGNLYVGFIPEVPAEKEAKLELKAKGYVYDIRTGKYKGYSTEKIQDIIKPGEAKVYGILPYRVEGIDVEVKGNSVRGGTITVEGNLKTSENKEPGTHIVAIRLYNSDGKEVEPYRNKVKTEKGRFKCQIPIALNDKTGKWKIEVEDIVSKVKGEVFFNLN